jgi:hypothetical protein
MLATLIVALIALFMLGIGIYGLYSPMDLARFAARWQTQQGLWTAAATRVVFGLALWQIAPASPLPTAFAVLAAVIVIAGLALPLIGLARFTALLTWWCSQPQPVLRAWGLVAALMGGLFLWSALG